MESRKVIVEEPSALTCSSNSPFCTATMAVIYVVKREENTELASPCRFSLRTVLTAKKKWDRGKLWDHKATQNGAKKTRGLFTFGDTSGVGGSVRQVRVKATRSAHHVITCSTVPKQRQNNT